MNKKTQSRVRNRDDPDEPFRLEIIEAPEALVYTKLQKSVNTCGFHVPQRAVRFSVPRGDALANLRYGRGAGDGRGLGTGIPLGATITIPVIPYSQWA